MLGSGLDVSPTLCARSDADRGCAVARVAAIGRRGDARGAAMTDVTTQDREAGLDSPGAIGAPWGVAAIVNSEGEDMSKLIVDVSLSLDGCMAGPEVGVDRPMGEGGERLHQWMFDEPDEGDAALARESSAAVGAVVLGRRTFDVGIGPWGDTPFPAPSFVVTHRPRAPMAMASGRFEFVGDVAGALERARAAADGGCVMAMGGEVSRQLLRAGQVDELWLHLVPVVLGRGLRLFDGADTLLELCPYAVQASPRVTHLKYRLRRGEAGGD